MIADGSAELVLHLAVGTGCLLLAAAAFDFGLPRWAAWIGCLSAAAFGGIFVLQGVAQIVGNDALTTLAFDVLGQEIERFLPDVILDLVRGPARAREPRLDQDRRLGRDDGRDRRPRPRHSWAAC